MTIDTAGKHFPKDPTCFRFDDEVSRIFPDMAKRSIPLYHDAHRLHARLVTEMLTEGAKIVDLGASRGQFFRTLSETHGDLCKRLHLIAIDASDDMCRYMRDEFSKDENLKEAIVHAESLECTYLLAQFLNNCRVVNLNYVLQFIPTLFKQNEVLRCICRSLPEGAILLLGQKYSVPAGLDALMAKEYVEWRKANGYTEEEIHAKTAALKGSMLTRPPATITRILEEEGFRYATTSQWLMFGTMIAVKHG